MHAAGNGSSECLDDLLEDEAADVNKPDNNGLTTLAHAASKGHSGCVKNLIAAGADVNITDEDGSTALMLAAMIDHKGIVPDFPIL